MAGWSHIQDLLWGFLCLACCYAGRRRVRKALFWAAAAGLRINSQVKGLPKTRAIYCGAKAASYAPSVDVSSYMILLQIILKFMFFAVLTAMRAGAFAC